MVHSLILFTHYGGAKISRSRFLASAKKNILILKAAALADFCIVTIVTSCEPFIAELDNSVQSLSDNKLLLISRWPLFLTPAVSRILCLFLLPLQMLWIRLFNDKPNLFAFYNTLASESVGMLMAALLYPDTPCILFYDDDLRARHSPRRALDLFFWSMAKKFSNIRHVFAVNNLLAAEVSQFGINSSILPCLVDLRPILKKSVNDCNRQLKICYSGGLEHEKGADMIFELAKNLSPDYCLNVTGSGSMQAKFSSLSGEINNVFYHGCLEEIDLISLYLESDVFLCLHTYMPGVFPFKIVEALYYGMVVISSPIDLPEWLSCIDGLIVLPSLNYSLNPVASLLNQLAMTASYAKLHNSRVSYVQDIIEKNCSVLSLALKLKSFSNFSGFYNYANS